MTTITLDFPEELLAVLRRRADSEGKSLEELVSDAVFSYYGIDNPKIRTEVHLKLCERLLREGEEFLVKKDYVQASEKFWGSASQMVKALAAERGLELRSHGELHKFVAELTRESRDPDVRRLWQSATSLHQNFYENWLPPEMVKGNADDVKMLIEKLRKLLKR
ncbi:MAG: hypothetical protein DRO36_05425 [Candidatus Hecatellales archaeon]|nr:MAG: hypothetical protein DRO36_05425 [Candidatus Hecatellales archaeon]